MDCRIEWSPEAVEDVEAIAEYIGRDSIFYARSVVSKLLATAMDIGRFTEVGRIVPELDDENIRERFVYSYRLIYRVEPSRVLIVAIIHGRRLIDRQEDRFRW